MMRWAGTTGSKLMSSHLFLPRGYFQRYTLEQFLQQHSFLQFYEPIDWNPVQCISPSLSPLPWSAAPFQASCSAATSFPQSPWRCRASWRSWRSWWRRRCHWRRRREGSWHTVGGRKAERERREVIKFMVVRAEGEKLFFFRLFAIYVSFAW